MTESDLMWVDPGGTSARLNAVCGSPYSVIRSVRQLASILSLSDDRGGLIGVGGDLDDLIGVRDDPDDIIG
ncbi:MAG: hypothetical protein WAZ19_01045, partial [Anaerolineae bacterium]